ncbi:MAG: hypothetical protein EXR75_05440 [Myxococcales bacterium]|nr:hypothetical protein [Myxococcales bacterium]
MMGLPMPIDAGAPRASDSTDRQRRSVMAIRRIGGELAKAPRAPWLTVAMACGPLACSSVAAAPLPISAPIVVIPPVVDDGMRVRDGALEVANFEPEPGMITVPGGPFPRGCSPADANCYANEIPARSIFIPSFAIDRTEVTVAGYRRCVEHAACSGDELGAHTNTQDTSLGPGTGSNSSAVLDTSASHHCNYPHADREAHPINCVSWTQASAYCRWLGKRLPTEAEWEKAARGVEPIIYPWGNEPATCERAVLRQGAYGCGRDGTWPIGSKPGGRASLGGLDMTGNVWEWVNDWYGDDYYAGAPDESPAGPETGIYRVVKGGGWADEVRGEVNSLRISNRYSYAPDLRFMHTGFRCAR